MMMIHYVWLGTSILAGDRRPDTALGRCGCTQCRKPASTIAPNPSLARLSQCVTLLCEPFGVAQIAGIARIMSGVVINLA